MSKKTKDLTIPSIQLPSKNILDTIGAIKWTNRYDCPNGYTFNEDGYVETDENYLQVNVSMMPFLLNAIGEEEVMYQNALALRVLNPNKHFDIVRLLIKYKFKSSYGREADTDKLQKAVERAYEVTDLGGVLKDMHRSIFSFQSIWCSRDCTVGGRKKIFGLLRDDYINRVRNYMTIETKFKTACVMDATNETEYAVNEYWKHTGLDRKTRSKQAVMEALEYLLSTGRESFTIVELAEVAGISRKTTAAILNE